MAKMSFEEWKLRKEYEVYLNSEETEPAEPEVKPEPKKAEPAPEAEEPEEPDYKKELEDIRKEMKLMAKALSPSLGDVQPVGVEDVVKKFFED